jgi:hypothetical protein
MLVHFLLCAAAVCCCCCQDNYLGKDQVTITLNFSKSAMNVIGQL